MSITAIPVNNLFSTYDLGLSSALVTAGFPLDHLDKSDLRKVQFVFLRAEGMDEVIEAYWNHHLPVDASTYFNTVKMLKNRIYSE